MSLHDQKEFSDFKYVLDGMTELSVGTKYTYAELIADDSVSYKFRCVCREYFSAEVDEDTTLESHLYYLSAGSRSYDAFVQMKTRVTVMVQDSSTGEERPVRFKERTLKIRDLVTISPAQKTAMHMVIREITVSKLALMSFVL